MATATDNPLVANVEYAYQQFGWSFTPLSGKRPTLKGWQSRPRETRGEAKAWAAKGNVGLRTGKASGLIVVDVDPGGNVSALGLPRTAMVNTGRGGLHVYLRCDAAIPNSAGKLGPHIDVRGDGGQVVFPGSIHPKTGVRYEWADGCEPWNIEIAECPQRIIDRLTRQEPRQEAPQPRRDANGPPATRYIETAIQRETDAVRTATEGTRNHALNSAAFNLGTLVGGGYVERKRVEAELSAAAIDAGLDAGEIAATIRSGVNSGMEHPRKVQMRPNPAEAPANAPAGRRKDFTLTPGAHRDDRDNYTEQSTASFACDALAGLPKDLLYRKDFVVGRLLGEPGRRKWVEVRSNGMQITVDQHLRLGKWVTKKATGEQVMVYQPCQREWGSLVIAQAEMAPAVRDLDLMVGYPVYGPGWKRIEPGYHDGLYYDEPPDLVGIEPITDCEVIHNVLCDLVIDFPFASEADRENFFGLMLTPIIVPAIDGNRPLHLITASLPRTGKTKLAEEVWGGVILGRPTAAMQVPEREEECDKRILALLIQGDTLVHLDNLPGYLDSPSLASLLTSEKYSSRMLGKSKNMALPNTMTVVASGNNIQATDEMVRRIVPIVLQPTTAHPEDRRDYHHKDLRPYVRKERRGILACLLGLVENWLGAGKPEHPSPLGGFEAWSRAVGGILKVNSFRAWRGNEKDWRRDTDPKGSEMEAFVETWHGAFHGAPSTPSELLQLAREEDFFPEIMAKPSEAGRTVTFGRMLKKHRDRPVGRFIIRHACGSSKRATYRLEAVADDTRSRA